ncbi:MAG TPA: DUF692 domain-containing protein [Blastocatellia bacterium]|nr:DUF692 domain-containing protein [Blastocatellia bacterium]
MNTCALDFEIGIGWRPELALSIARNSRINFVEVVAENISPDRIPLALEQLAERNVKVAPHGVSLSLGGAEPPCGKRLSQLARLAERLNSPMVSEHVAFVRAGGIEAGHLLPLPRTHEALDVLVENILEAKRALPVPLALENIATLFEWPHAEMDEVTFLTEALRRTDTLLLLDVSNLYANARNHDLDAIEFLDRLPLDRLAYVHIAGGVTRAGLYHDTHAHRIPAGALDLLEELCARARVPGVVLERDDLFPEEAELVAELEAIAEARARGARRRESVYAY